MQKLLLIPIDFSSYSFLACKVGFELARRLNLTPMVMHVYPFVETSLAAPPITGFSDFTDDEVEEMETQEQVRENAEKQMDKFVKMLMLKREDKEITDVKFVSSLKCGLPEEVILTFARTEAPALIVMATRGSGKKKVDLIGSVTAEVIDSCRVPVFTVPEDYDFRGLSEILRIGMFCAPDEKKDGIVQSFMEMFDGPKVDITLFPVDVKRGMSPESMLTSVQTYLSTLYPEVKFSIHPFSGKEELRKEIENYLSDHNIQLLIIPNKKRNIFSRLFNPGIAHRILFERDTPMLVFPI